MESRVTSGGGRMHIGDTGTGVTTDPAAHERRLGQSAAAAARYRDAEPLRETIRQRRADGMRYPDEPERLARRARRLVQAGAVPGELLLAMAPDEDPLKADERIIGGSNDLQAAAFLPRGVRAGATVGRIWLTVGRRRQPCATGFLIAPRLFLTNHHVFPDAGTTDGAFVEFGAEAGMDDLPGTTVAYEFAPDVFFLADDHLDYALVALRPGLDGRPAGDAFGWNRLDPAEGKLVVGDPLNIIGHPSGRLKEICIRDNQLLVRLDDFLHYKTDTEPGNSGSPVFNDQWEVVALHHSGVPATDDHGRTLNTSGGVWTAAQGEAAVQWVANEGARISAVLRHLAANTPQASRGVLAELGPAAGPQPVAVGPQVLVPPQAASVGAGPQAPVAPVAAAGVSEAAGAAAGAAAATAVGVDAAGSGATGSPSATGTAGTSATATGAGVGAAETSAAGTAVPGPRAAESGVGVLTGIGGRRDAFGATRQLVFLHGRSQHGHHPEDLRRLWTAGLNNGLTRLGYRTIDPADVYFPYYGDRLAAVLNTRESVTTSFEAVADDPGSAAAPAEPSARELYDRLLLQAAERAGMPDAADTHPEERFGIGGVVKITRRPLDWLARHSGVDRLLIASAFRDVALYLDNRRIRDEVLACVRETVPSDGGIVLVAHSLGTVIAMDLLASAVSGPAVAALVTLGAPLGLDTVHDRLITRGPHCPPHVPWWFNAWSPTDGVAIGCPLKGRWSGLTLESAVDNPRDRAHDIDEYLTRPEVAAAIAARLDLPRR